MPTNAANEHALGMERAAPRAQVARSAVAHQQMRVWRAERRLPRSQKDCGTIDGLRFSARHPPWGIVSGDMGEPVRPRANPRGETAFSCLASPRRKPGSSVAMDSASFLDSGVRRNDEQEESKERKQREA